MEENVKVDKDYKEAFNQGYELSKELGLKAQILKDINAGNNRMQAMKDGMEQYQKDKMVEKEKDVIPPFDIDSVENNYTDVDLPEEDKNKGLDIDI